MIELLELLVTVIVVVCVMLWLDIKEGGGA